LVRYPLPLSHGDTVFVTAPSSGVEPRLHARLDLALEHLQAQGFRVEQGRCLRQQHHDASASAQERAAEMRHLRWCGWFEGVAGVMLGRSAGPDAADATRLSYAQAARHVLGDLPCPVLMDVDVGHLPPQWTLVLAAHARVRWTQAQGVATIEQHLR
jgi:muramoyltetrapeptide carboxypeptidase LdcA involved in peptidoglycan recycling